MVKRVYSATVLKWLAGLGIPGTLVTGIFIYLSAIGAIEVHDYSGDMVCAGTSEDPCYAYINLTANEDIFIYPIGYDPWGRDTFMDFNPAVVDWKLERSWGDYWKNIPLDINCTGTWCGAPDNKGNVAYSIAFREGKTYNVRITAYKNNPHDTIKWGAFLDDKNGVDPLWEGIPVNMLEQSATYKARYFDRTKGSIVECSNWSYTAKEMDELDCIPYKIGEIDNKGKDVLNEDIFLYGDISKKPKIFNITAVNSPGKFVHSDYNGDVITSKVKREYMNDSKIDWIISGVPHNIWEDDKIKGRDDAKSLKGYYGRKNLEGDGEHFISEYSDLNSTWIRTSLMLGADSKEAGVDIPIKYDGVQFMTVNLPKFGEWFEFDINFPGELYGHNWSFGFDSTTDVIVSSVGNSSFKDAYINPTYPYMTFGTATDVKATFLADGGDFAQFEIDLIGAAPGLVGRTIEEFKWEVGIQRGAQAYDNTVVSIQELKCQWIQGITTAAVGVSNASHNNITSHFEPITNPATDGWTIVTGGTNHKEFKPECLGVQYITPHLFSHGNGAFERLNITFNGTEALTRINELTAAELPISWAVNSSYTDKSGAGYKMETVDSAGDWIVTVTSDAGNNPPTWDTIPDGPFINTTGFQPVHDNVTLYWNDTEDEAPTQVIAYTNVSDFNCTIYANFSLFCNASNVEGNFNITLDGLDSGGASANTSFNIQADTRGPNCTLITVTPSDIQANSTGVFDMTVNCSDFSGINLSKNGVHHSAFFTTTVDDDFTTPNFWSLFFPDNNLAVEDSNGGQVWRATGRNESYWYDFIGQEELDADVFTYSVFDGTYDRFRIQANGSNQVLYNISAPVELIAFKISFPLNIETMQEEDKSDYLVDKDDGLMVKFWDIGALNDSGNYTLTAWGNFFYTDNPNKDFTITYCNQSYLDITCGGDFLTGCSSAPQDDIDNCVFLNSLPKTTFDTRGFTEKNSSYVGDTYGINDGLIGGIVATNYSYIYYKSDTSSTTGSYTIRYANDSSGTNTTFAQTNLAFASTDDGSTYSQLPGTADIFLNTRSEGDQFKLGGCTWDLLGNEFCNYSFLVDDIDDVNYPISSPNIQDYYLGIKELGDDSDSIGLNGEAYGNISVHVNIAIDPDAPGTVNHSLYLYNSTGEFVAIINSSFYSPDDGDIYVHFDTRSVPDGTYKTNVTAVADDDVTDLQDHITVDNFTIFNPYPIWKDNHTFPENVCNFSQDMEFNITIINEIDLADSVTFYWEESTTGIVNESFLLNYTNNSVVSFKLNVSYAVGNYTYYFIANNSIGFENRTDTWDYEILKNIGSVTLLLDGLEDNRKYEYQTTVNITVLGNEEICISVDTPDLGPNFICGSSMVDLAYNISTLNLDNFDNLSNVNLTFGTNPQVINFTLPSNVTIESVSFNMSSWDDGSGNFASNVYLDLLNDGIVEVSMPGNLTNKTLHQSYFINGLDRERILFTIAGTKSRFINISTFFPDILNGTINLSGGVSNPDGLDYVNFFYNSSDMNLSGTNASTPYWSLENFGLGDISERWSGDYIITQGSSLLTSVSLSLTDVADPAPFECETIVENSDSDQADSNFIDFEEFGSINARVKLSGAGSHNWGANGCDDPPGGSGQAYLYLRDVSLGTNTLIKSVDGGCFSSSACSGDDTDDSVWTIEKHPERTQFDVYDDGVFSKSIGYNPNNDYELRWFVTCTVRGGLNTAECSARTQIYYVNASGITGQELNNFTWGNGTFVSNQIKNFSSNITSAQLDWDEIKPTGTDIVAWLSADNGTTWESVQKDITHIFTIPGDSLSYKFWVQGLNQIDSSGDLSKQAIVKSVELEVSQGFPENITLDVGDDGIIDWEHNATLNDTQSVVANWSFEPLLNYIAINCQKKVDCAVPLKFSIASSGTLVWSDLSQNISFSNFNFLDSDILNNLTLESTNGNVTVNNIYSSTFGILEFSELDIRYIGEEDVLVNASISNNANSTGAEKLLNVTIRHSKFNITLPKNLVYWEVIPTNLTDYNVTPYGQLINNSLLESVPIFNVTNLAKIDPFDLYVSFNESNLDCIDSKLGNTIDVADTIIVTNNSEQVVIGNLSIDNSTGLFMFNDYKGCSYNDIFQDEAQLIFNSWCSECVVVD